MSRRQTLRTLLLLSFCLVLLACGQSEKKAQTLFDQATQREQQGDIPGAVEQYQRLLTEFPATKVAQQAQVVLQGLLQRLEAERKVAQARNFRESSYQAVDSIVKVIDGYKAMYNRLPRQARDFDNGTFFFDTGYMAETVPDGFRVYLALGSGGAYRLWSIKGGETDCFVLDGKTATFDQIPQPQALKEISTRYVEERRQGNLVFLRAKAPGGKVMKR